MSLRLTQDGLARVAVFLACASAVAALASIAASQLLLALALAALLMSNLRLRLPPVWLPLAVFLAGTLVAIAASENPAAGRPQVRKLFAYLMLPVVYSAVGSLRQARVLVAAWGALASASALVALGQFVQKAYRVRTEGVGFYEYYVGERISGFMSHWMTFGAQMMIVVLMLVAFLLFSVSARGHLRWPGILAVALIAVALVLNMTRSIWLASGVAALYLVWHWKRHLLWLAPVALAAVLAAGPGSVRTRLISIVQPRQEVDSNLHRIVCWRTGLRMVQAHPWLGLGPEVVRLRFNEYVPPDAPQPLPRGWYGHLHNLYLHYAAERGIPTAMALVWLLAQAFWELNRAARRAELAAPEARFLLHGAAACVLAIALAGFFEVNLGDSEVLMLFLAVLACGYLAR
ncbi:MAG: O-antigen ligase family protein, partial [Bryobacteraceae bacterium]